MAGHWEAQIDADLRWREDELASLKQLLVNSLPGSQREQALLRANVAMLYAHYEGFCKYCWAILVDGLMKMAPKRSESTPQLAALSIYSEVRRGKLGESPEAAWDFIFSRLSTILDEPLSFDDGPPDIANLWPDLLIKWSSRFGLPTAVAKDNHKRLEQLVANRNNIAHGKKLVIRTIKEYAALENAAVLAMHELGVAVAVMLENKTFKRSQVYTTLPHRSFS